MRRSTRLGLAVAAVASVALLALAGCGRLGGAGSGSGVGTSDQASADMTDLSWEGQALQAIGYSPDQMTPAAAVVNDPAPAPSASTKDRQGRAHRFKRLRFAFGRHLLHGEAVVQTDEGTKTVVVQRGTVTAIDATSVTVKSTDGFTLTWKIGDPIHVVEHRTAVQPSAVKVGAAVGVAGAKDGDTAVARLIVIPGTK